eukprot:CAMPEP_0177669192 /NCGR_PEP_ID=MMETSP0447-20121125/23285_1 /TAXON_ID=0 /ORGANISM="Stygamoeba regulata, Strain BSH-02190019" /LENGTH=120 /DNA_ID=CAMNT_0019175993 /DNA_START=173 /DNA_END=535 /DNA_ORIENTATION=+
MGGGGSKEVDGLSSEAKSKCTQALESGELDLQGLHLSRIPPAVVNSPDAGTLTSVDLSFNSFTTGPENIMIFQNVTLLNLSGNQLVTVAPEIVELRQLAELMLNGNVIEALPTRFGELSS